MKHPEHICRFNDGSQSCDCYDSGFEEGKKQEREEIKQDYINWVLSGNIKDYNGQTPFYEWKDKAEVRSMQSWN